MSPAEPRSPGGATPRRRRRFAAADLAVLVLVAAVVLALGLSEGGGGPAGTVEVSFASAPVARIPRDFLGLSMEYSALPVYAGPDAAAPDPVFLALARGLDPHGTLQLRIGGKSSDATWWPVPGVARPPGVSYTLTPAWLRSLRAVLARLRAHVVLGINLEAGSTTLAGAEARALLAGLGPGEVRALELGNEPNLYGVFTYYRTPGGRRVTGRPRGYDFAGFLADFSALAATLPAIPLAGPAVNIPTWQAQLPQFLAGEPTLGLVTAHRYPLQLCFIHRDSPRYPTIANLLSDRATARLASLMAPWVRGARGAGLPLRADELNSVGCGADRPVSQSFAAALWMVQALFRLAAVGVTGVNIHTFPGAGYELFRVLQRGSRWSAAVAPEYLGLLLFARAAPAGAALLPARGTLPAGLHAWATRTLNGTVRVVLDNESLAHAYTVRVRPPLAAGGPGGTGAGGTGGAVGGAAGGGAGGAAGGAAGGSAGERPARLQRLRAPSASATAGATLGGRGFGPATSTGVLARPVRLSVPVRDGVYEIRLPAASAAELTLR